MPAATVSVLLDFVAAWERNHGNLYGVWNAAADEFGESRAALRSRWRRNRNTSLPPRAAQLPEEAHELTIETSGNVLIIGDTHEPFARPDYLGFCQRMCDRFSCDTVIHIGDLVDNHAASYHESDPDGLSAGDEGEEAQARLWAWFDAFPDVVGLYGNHDAIPARKAKSGGLSRRFVRTFRESWQLPAGWQWVQRVKLNDVLVRHNPGRGGATPALLAAKTLMCSVIGGHFHTAGGAWWHHGELSSVFGLSVGCGIDPASYAMAYAKEGRPIVNGCGILVGGELPVFVPM